MSNKNNNDSKILLLTAIVGAAIVYSFFLSLLILGDRRQTMSANNNNNDSKILLTAIGAAIGGAALAVAAMKFTESKKDNEESQFNMHTSNRKSFIFDDLSNDVSDPSNTMNKLHHQGSSDAILFPHNHEEKMKRRIANRVVVEEDNRMPRNSVTVRVPASSANMGGGYDCIGMAVDLWSEVTITRSDKFEITAEGEGASEMPKDKTNYMVTGVKAAFEAANKPVPILKYHVISRIPYARGLGSSSAAIVAGIIGGLILAGHRLPCWGSEALLQIAASIEGHPDNVAPVIYGGIQIGIHNGTRWVTERAPTPAGLQCVLFIPDFVGKTSAARSVLSQQIPREDAAFNISRVAFFVHALCLGNLDNLKWGVQDKMHQPQRGATLYKYLYPMIEAAENAGACCAYLSGAGPTVMALTSGASGDIFTQREKERNDSAVARAMMEVATSYNIQGKLLVTSSCHEGARVMKVDPPFSTVQGITYRDNI